MSGERRNRRSPNLALTVLITIYVVAFVASAVLYVLGFTVTSSDPHGAVALFVFANGFGALALVGALLHLAVAAIRHVVEDGR